MTLPTYLSGERIQGLSSDILETIAHEDDFSSDNYAHVSSGTDVTGGVFIFATSNDDQRGRKDLSVAMGSDDFLIDYDSNVGNGALGHLYASLILSENDTQPKAGSSNDAYDVVTTGGGSSKMNILLSERNGGSDNQSLSTGNVFNVNTVYFFRLTKEGTTLKIRGYATDSDRGLDTSVIGTTSLTLTGGFTNKLDVLQHGSWTNVNNVTGVTIDNLSIYNGVSSITSKPTNVPVGTRYEETDTRKIFHRRTQTGGAGGDSWVEKGTALEASALRGLFGGGQPNSVLIDYIAIQTLGNAADFGDLITAREFPAACADSTRGVWAAGGDPRTSVIEYVTVATLGNAVDFGASTTGGARRELSGVADSTRGVFSGGHVSGGTETNTQDFITIQTTGTCTDFGDLSATRASVAGCASATRGVVAGGYNSSNAAQDWIDYFTIQTTGSAVDAGNLMESNYALTGCSDLSRGIIAGGNAGGNTNRIQWITISSTANAQDFGDLTVARSGTAACADSTRGVIGGGYNHPPGHRVDTDYITIQTTGNATDFGDLTTSLAGRGGLAA